MRSLSPSTLTAVAGITGLVKVFKGLVGGINDSIHALAGFESMQTGLQTFYHSAEVGKDLFDKLRKYSNTTTFGVDELANASTQLLNVGVNSSELTEKLTQLGNIAQGDKAKFAELTSIFAKIGSTGKASSVQLQQLALRGVPIYDQLKKIGVTGTATFSDIEKVFKNLTDEGGQFYNAMENINDTITGKEGFISDYFREFKANFAEASGLADAYKKTLDIVQNALGDLVDLMYAINENPVMKAIFQGAIVTGLVAIAGVIGGALLGAIKKLNKDLAITAMLKGIISPKTLAITGIVAGIAGISAGLIAWKKHQNELNNSIDETAESQKKLLAIAQTEGLTGVYSSKIDTIQTQIDELEKQKKTISSVQTSSNMTPGMSVGNFFVQGINAKNAQNNAELQTQIDSELTKLRKEKTELENAKTFDIATKAIQAIQGENPDDEVNSQIRAYQEQIDALNKYVSEGKKIIYDYNKDGSVKDFKIVDIDNTDITNAKNAIDKINGYIGTARKQLSSYKNDWTGTWETITGQDASSRNGKALAKTYIESLKEQQKLESSAYLASGQEDVSMENYKQRLTETLQSLMLSNQFTVEDNAIKALMKELKGSNNDFGLSNFSKLAQLQDIPKNIVGTTQNAIDGSDIGNMISAFTSGLDPLTAIILYFAEEFIELISSIDSLNDALNLSDELLKPLVNVLEPFIDATLKPILSLLETLGETLALIISPITQLATLIMSMVGIVFKFVEIPLKLIGNAFTWLNDEVIVPFGNKVIDGLNWLIEKINALFGLDLETIDRLKTTEELLADEQESEYEKLQKLNDELSDLLDAMKEQEEYYLKTKTSLNAQAYNSTKVNDMILTPQGNFSTNPSDYIIATKNPNALSGSGVTMQVQINNSASESVTATATKTTDSNGMERLIVQISKKVAQDVANGSNGWDNALNYRENRISGRLVYG